MKRLVSVLAIGLLTAACGSGGKGGTGSSSSPSATATAQGAAVKTSDDLAFVPAAVTVKVGQSVTWSNPGPQLPHTVTFDAKGVFDKPLPVGAAVTFTATRPGVFKYKCTIHPVMTGTVTVQ